MTVLSQLTLSPAEVARSMRGEVIGANRAYPDVLQLAIRDARGDVWDLTTLDATWMPQTPEELLGRIVVDGSLDEETHILRLAFADGGDFVVRPDPEAAADDPPTWEVITPAVLCLRFGPHGSWHVTRADVPLGPR
jgi:hypothetical protein